MHFYLPLSLFSVASCNQLHGSSYPSCVFWNHALSFLQLYLLNQKILYTSSTSAASDTYNLCLYSIILLVYNVIPNRNNFLETMCNKVLRPKGYIPVLWMIYTAAIQIATEVIFHLKPSLTFCGHISCQNDACLEISFHFAFEYFLLVDVWCRWLRRACPCPNGHCPKCQIGNFWSVGNSSKHRKIHKFMFHALTSRPFINCRNINSQQCWWQSVKKIMNMIFWDFCILLMVL